MLTGITTTPDHAPAMLAADMADAQLVGAMRLVLAVSVLLASLTEPISFHAGADLAWMLFAVYVAHSLLLYAVALARRPLAASKLQHWLLVLEEGSKILISSMIFSQDHKPTEFHEEKTSCCSQCLNVLFQHKHWASSINHGCV